MAQYTPATWKNTNVAPLIEAANRGSAAATQQIVGGIQGVGQAFTDFDKANVQKEELARKAANEEARLALLQSADVRAGDTLELKKSESESKKKAESNLTSLLDSIQDTGSTEGNLKLIRESTANVGAKDKDTFRKAAKNKLGVLATTTRQARDEDSALALDAYKSASNIDPPASLGEMASDISEAVKANPNVNKNQYLKQNEELFLNLATDDIINTSNQQSINDALSLAQQSITGLDQGLDDEELGKRKNALKGLSDQIREMLVSGNDTISGFQLDKETENRLTQRVAGSNTPLGELIRTKETLEKGLAELGVETRKQTLKEAKAVEKDYGKFKVQNTPTTLLSSMKKTTKGKTEFRDEIKEVKSKADKLIRDTVPLFREHPEFVVAAIKELVTPEESGAVLGYWPAEILTGWDEDAILTRATELYNFRKSQGLFGKSEKANEKTRKLVEEAMSYISKNK